MHYDDGDDARAMLAVTRSSIITRFNELPAGVLGNVFATSRRDVLVYDI